MAPLLVVSSLSLIFFCFVHVSGFNFKRLPHLKKLSTNPASNCLLFSSSEVEPVQQTTDSTSSAAVSVEVPTAPSPTTPVPAAAPLEYRPDGTAYITCGACKTAYVVQDNMFKRGGARVKCSVCMKEWFQNGEKLQATDDENKLVSMSQTKVDEVKRIIADRNFPKYPRVDKIGVFIGNLPYTYDEKDIMNLIAEYGVTSVSLVKDPEGQSKGFAFAEVGYLTLAAEKNGMMITLSEYLIAGDYTRGCRAFNKRNAPLLH